MQLHLPFHSAANGEPARARSPWLRAIATATSSFVTAGRRRTPQSGALAGSSVV
jgi:hypothetical protein